MQAVRRENTAPELAVRRFLHAKGLRYSLHGSTLVGHPDLVLPYRLSVVFVHGCFWHGHDYAHGAVKAKSNAAFWARKLADNRARDVRQQALLRAEGWRVEVVWECEARDPRCLGRLARRLLRRHSR